MKATNAISSTNATAGATFSTVITSKTMQSLIAKSMPDARAAARFTGTMISVVNSSEKLKACDPQSVIASALRGEGEGLILGHGYYVVPYGSVAQYQRSYKGYIALAMSTGYYADIDCVDVREGELTGLDPRKCKPNINFSTYSSLEERQNHPIIGYYAYFELKDGMFRFEYWNKDKILRHADKYSKAFSLKQYQKLESGELDPKEAEKLLNGSPWYDIGGGQEDMMKKTVLRKLLNSGYAPLSNEVRLAFNDDGDEGFTPGIDRNTIEATEYIVRDDSGDFNAPVANDAPAGAATPKTDENAAVGKRTAKSGGDKDFTAGFFG